MSTNLLFTPEVPVVPLTYTVVGSSAHSGRYAAENILVDKNTDHSSRWSGSSQSNTNQWILLRLENLTVLKTITFGKFHKSHPCNMKEFKLYVGTKPEYLSEILHTGLKNDHIPETFIVKQVNNAGLSFPTRYIKIVPISAHGQSFHTSIWHISLTGVTDEAYVEQVREKYDEYRETIVLKHVLKHLRQRRLLTPFESIISRTTFQFEHPHITKLHQSVVLQGNWKQAENLITAISKDELCNSYLLGSQPYAVWKQLHGTDPDGDVPPPRGGHAMCIDPVKEVIYLFGGWDGHKSLDDFWSYDINEDRWHVLSHSTSQEQNAPGARSCHKMVFDTKTESIYLLGRLSDSDSSIGKPESENGTPVPSRQNTLGDNNAADSSTTSHTYCSEFYRYHTHGADRGKWDFLAFDTAVSGGPPLIFDQQMVLDCDAQIIYVFGGRVVDGDWSSTKYSGLYSYNIRTSKWKLLLPADGPNSYGAVIPPRFGHSMVLEPSTRTLFIFAGQREDRYLSDMYAYDIATNTTTRIFSNFFAAGGPGSSFTQRAVIDPNLRELYIFCGLTRTQQPGGLTNIASDTPNWMFAYDQPPGAWTQILPQPPTSSVEHNDHLESGEPVEPSPRYAHQVVYNPRTKTVFLHGGNAGVVGPLERSEEEGQREQRMDDLWQMTPGSDEVVRRATYKLRQQQFKEMCEDEPPTTALNFLQTEVFSVVDHSDLVETDIFRSLLSHLIDSKAPLSPSSLEPNPSLSLTRGEEPSPDDDNLPPRKRTRPNSPETEGKWTNQLEGNRTGNSAWAVGDHALKDMEDPLEHKMRSATEVKSDTGKLTSARFAQRNEVFESLLGFVSDEAKQPTGSLLDLVGMNEGGL